MDAFVQDVLNYSKILRADLPTQQIDLEKFLSGIVESYPNLHEPETKIEIDKPLPPVLANPAALTQLVLNIMGNAITFLKKNGTKAAIHISADELPNKQVCLSIQDNGIGIRSDMHEEIFLMFQRLNPLGSYDETEIGLAM